MCLFFTRIVSFLLIIASFHSFFVFDLTSIDGFVINASLLLELESYNSPDTYEFFTVYSVSTSIDELLEDRPAEGPFPPPPNTTVGQAIFTDLGSGSVYGSAQATFSSVGSIFEIDLSSEAVQDINDNINAFFAVGIALNDIGMASQDGLDLGGFCRSPHSTF